MMNSSEASRDDANTLGLSHGDQYKMLREEIMQRMRDIHQTEIFGAIGLGIVYAWLILHDAAVSSPILWFIGPSIVVLGAISCWVNVFEIWRIGGYLAQIEEIAFAGDEKLPGWERYQKISARERRLVRFHLSLSVTIWICAFVLTIWASCALSAKPRKPLPATTTLSAPSPTP
jgi:hypothetical protein